MLKKLSALSLVLTLMLAICIAPISAKETNSEEQTETIVSNHVELYSASQYTESVLAYPGENLGPTTMSFTGNRLTISGNASVNSGSASSVTVRLKKQMLGNTYTTIATATLPTNGQGVNILRDVVITPNSNYKISYQVNGSAGATANVFIAAISWSTS